MNFQPHFLLSIIYDENIVEYIFKCGKINYSYDAEGKLIRISDAYTELFSFTRANDGLTIKDGSGRTTQVVMQNGNVTSIIDAGGSAVNYYYENDNLVRVVDQAGVILDTYAYTDNQLTKSNDVAITYDDEGRVTEYLKDNGYFTRFAYSTNTVKVTTASEQNTEIKYNTHGNIISTTEKNGKKTTYSYDTYQNLTAVKVDDTAVNEYQYDKYGRLTYQKDSSGEIKYFYDGYSGKLTSKTVNGENASSYSYYDDNGRVYREHSGDEYIYYLYDNNDNVTLKAVLVDDGGGNYPYEYDAEREYDSVYKYSYENGQLVKAQDVTNNSETLNQYDECFNLVCATITTQDENGNVSVSVTNNTYDIFGRVLSTKSGDSETVYTYDAAGRTLLINADGLYHRTVYDNLGRIVQEIEDVDYNPELDNLPNAYSDTNAGQRYFYDEYSNMYKEINRYGLQTDYYYSDDGLLFIKSFDIYDFYYNKDGSCEHIDVNGYTAVSYEYDIHASGISVSSKQTLNSITYANGNVEKQLLDKNGNVERLYRNDETTPYYRVLTRNQTSVSYKNEDKGFSTAVTSNEDTVTLESQRNASGQNATYYQYYSQSTNDDVVNISENHFNLNSYYYETINDNSITYRSDDTAEYICYYESDENASSQTVKNEDVTIFDSGITYDEASKSFVKIYNKPLAAEMENLASFSYAYDENGNIVEDENNHYSYNELGELVETTGSVNASYTYNGRGNMTSKTVDGVTTVFSYDSNWWDQLVSVNGEPLTYDASGNLTAYKGKEYKWSSGKRLESITDGENTYSYKYDEKGIRYEKQINDDVIKINTLNGRICAQQINATSMYFQYDSNAASFGFIYDGVQYFYITNLSGDVVGITDSNGELLARYTYDEWGKLLSITTAEEGNEEQQRIAELNPLRYRGYYYDNETGMYYLQSRYYDPDLGRFISADDFSYINNNNPLYINAYAYCLNNPISYVDYDGRLATEVVAGSLFSVFLEEIIAFLSEILAYAVVGLTVGSIIAGLYIVGVVISAVISSIVSNRTKTLPDVKAKRQSGGHYKVAYINSNNEMIYTSNKKLTFVEALSALGITATTNDISKRYSFVYRESKVSSSVKAAHAYKNWGIYADSQEAAKALAVVLGCTSSPEVHGSGYYGHYNDPDHNIHIWYGSKIWY